MSCVIIVLVIVAFFFYIYACRKIDPERSIRFIAKYISIFCFQMKGGAVFD